MVEISPSRSLPLDQVVVVGGIKQQLHSTTTTVTLLRHCHCSLLLLVLTGDARPSSPDLEGGRGVAVVVVPPSLSSRPNPPHTALNHPATLAQAIAPPATKASVAARCCNVALHPCHGAVPPPGR